MENKPRILFFGFSDVGYKCLKLLLDKGCDERKFYPRFQAHYFEN